MIHMRMRFVFFFILSLMTGNESFGEDLDSITVSYCSLNPFKSCQNGDAIYIVYWKESDENLRSIPREQFKTILIKLDYKSGKIIERSQELFEEGKSNTRPKRIRFLEGRLYVITDYYESSVFMNSTLWVLDSDLNILGNYHFSQFNASDVFVANQHAHLLGVFNKIKMDNTLCSYKVKLINGQIDKTFFYSSDSKYACAYGGVLNSYEWVPVDSKHIGFYDFKDTALRKVIYNFQTDSTQINSYPSPNKMKSTIVQMWVTGDTIGIMGPINRTDTIYVWYVKRFVKNEQTATLDFLDSFSLHSRMFYIYTIATDIPEVGNKIVMTSLDGSEIYFSNAFGYGQEPQISDYNKNFLQLYRINDHKMIVIYLIYDRIKKSRTLVGKIICYQQLNMLRFRQLGMLRKWKIRMHYFSKVN